MLLKRKRAGDSERPEARATLGMGLCSTSPSRPASRVGIVSRRQGWTAGGTCLSLSLLFNGQVGKFLRAAARPSCWLRSACRPVPIAALSAFCPRRGAAGRFARPSLGGSWREGTRHRCRSPLQPPGETTRSFHPLSLSACTQSKRTEVDSNLDVSRSDTRTSSEMMVEVQRDEGGSQQSQIV